MENKPTATKPNKPLNQAPGPMRPAAVVPGRSDGTNSAIVQAFQFLLRLANVRLDEYFGHPTDSDQLNFHFEPDDSRFSQMVTDWQMDVNEMIALTLALSPHVQPALLQDVIGAKLKKEGELPIMGGVKGRNSRGFLPTGETVLFLLGGMDVDRRLKLSRWLVERQSRLLQAGVLQLEKAADGDPVTSGRLQLAPEYLHFILDGSEWHPEFGADFPAQRLTTKLEWEDLVLAEGTLQALHLLEEWLQQNEIIDADPKLGRRVKPGFRALFHGPPGTGKTLSATLIAKKLGREVYRVDLSQIVSKYIGETEKNLRKIFDLASGRSWILFFDEADALFGKRTEVKSSHDRFANQEVSYLLQRVEDHNGLVILATNFRKNLDKAFLRRFQSTIHFAPPTEEERLRLWQDTFPANIPLAQDVAAVDLARRYEVTGADIVTIVQSAALRALSGKRPIRQEDLLDGIREAYGKTGRSL